jgi:hypothetical protein
MWLFSSLVCYTALTISSVVDVTLDRNMAFRIVVQVQAILRLTVSRPVCPRISPPSGSRNQFFFLATDIAFGYLRELLVQSALSDERKGL